MSGSEQFVVSQSNTGDRSGRYSNRNRRNNQVLKQQRLRRNNQEQEDGVTVTVTDAVNRINADHFNATLSIPSLMTSSMVSRRSRPLNNFTNLDSFLDSVTPIIPAQNSPQENEIRPYYCIGDLWETFEEWSAYGTGVPFLLYGRYPTTQYYVPYLSGMQLYVDPKKTDTRFGCTSSSSGAIDREADIVLDSSFGPHKLVNRVSFSDNKTEICGSRETLAFEFMEQEMPHIRKPFAVKASFLASEFPELSKYRSCDLSPSSWICIAWYPIYRIPVGPTLKDLEASFLTLHSLSTQPGSETEFTRTSGRDIHGVRLPVMGLASYKLKGSIISPCDPKECEKENSLMKAARNWLRDLQALLPDYQFFLNRYSRGK